MKAFSVWVGGGEVTDYLVTKAEAEEIAEYWRSLGYTDVAIDNYEENNE